MSFAAWRSALRRPYEALVSPATFRRSLMTSRPYLTQSNDSSHAKIDIEALLSKATWSINSLLPPKDTTSQKAEISSAQLHHLLRLSALPPPRDAAEEEKMLSTLSSQLHFVKEIQAVNTTGIEPLRSLRDETAEGEKDAELGLEALRDALAQEEVRGRFHKRIRRRRDGGAKKIDDGWDPLQTAGTKVGRFFVVEGGKDG